MKKQEEVCFIEDMCISSILSAIANKVDNIICKKELAIFTPRSIRVGAFIFLHVQMLRHNILNSTLSGVYIHV